MEIHMRGSSVPFPAPSIWIFIESRAEIQRKPPLDGQWLGGRLCSEQFPHRMSFSSDLISLWTEQPGLLAARAKSLKSSLPLNEAVPSPL